MTIIQNPIAVAILSYTPAMQAAVLGLRDLLEMANRFQASRTPTGTVFAVEIIEEPPKVKEQFDIVVLPPALSQEVSGDELSNIVKWLPEQHTGGATIASVCAGCFPLAASGLLQNRIVTTHWALADEFAKRYPDVSLDADKILIDDGDIITAGGLMAWVDLGLNLVQRVMGSAVMLETARFFLVDVRGREQRFYSSFSPRLNHGDTAVLKSQHWLQEHFASAISVAAMAEIAGLGARTFSRRFLAATGLNASQYLQNLRIAKAREKFETTQDTVDAISYSVGYEDVSAFRKVFYKIVGLTPREYRKRFSASEP